jgi:hypothetical protein
METDGGKTSIPKQLPEIFFLLSTNFCLLHAVISLVPDRFFGTAGRISDAPFDHS